MERKCGLVFLIPYILYAVGTRHAFSLPSVEEVGDYLFANSQYEEALAICRLIHKEKPTGQLKLRIGACLYALGDKENAIYWLSKAQESNLVLPAAEKLLRRIYFDNGIAELGNDRLDSALFWFKKADAKYGVGFVNYKLGNYEKAKELFNELGDVYAVGAIYYQVGHFKEAIEYFKKLVCPSVCMEREIGACLYRMGDYRAAVDYFVRTGDNFFAAECYYRLGDFKEAAQYYKKYLEYPATRYETDALYGLAWSHYKLGEFNSSAEEFTKCRSKVTSPLPYPDMDLRPTCMYYAGRSYLKSNKPLPAIEVFKELINEYPGHELMPNAYYWLGKAYFETSNYDSCIQSLKALITMYPRHDLCQYAYSILGNVYREIANYDSAIVWYNYVNSPAWLLDEARFRIEECYFELGVYNSKIDIWRNFVRKYPESSRTPKLAFEIGKYWERENKLGEAISAYSKVCQEFSWSPYATRAKLGLGDCYFRVKETSRAIEIYKELLNTNFRKEALVRLGNTYFSLADYDQAIREYALLVNEFPESEFAVEAHYRIGLSYEELEKYGEARLAFAEFIEKFPESPKLWEAWLKLAKTYWNEGLITDYEKTLLYIKSEGKGRARQEAIFLLGALYFDKGDYEYAQTYYLESYAQYEDVDSKSMALIGAARCAKTLGKIDEAKKLYEEVIALAPNPRLEELVKKEIHELMGKESK